MANGPEVPAAIEDGIEEESRMIGQELVPFRGVEAVEEEQREAVSPELIRDLGPSTSLVESAQERALVTSSAAEAQEDRASRVRPIGVEKAEEVMSPVQPEELWPGGPTSKHSTSVWTSRWTTCCTLVQLRPAEKDAGDVHGSTSRLWCPGNFGSEKAGGA